MKNSMKLLKSNKEKGITLIALVVTIVVLLILAGITITYVLGEDGIIAQAKNAAERTRNEEEKAQYELGKLPEKIENWVNGGSGSGGTTNPEGTKTIVEAFNAGEIKVGDYVNYENPASGTATVVKEETGYSQDQTYTVDSETTWRVLGLSEDKQSLVLISGSPIKRSTENGSVMPVATGGGSQTTSPYLAMGGAESYINCEDTLNKICNIYKNNLAKEARSVKMEDVLNALEITVNKAGRKATYKDGTELSEEEFQHFFDQSKQYDGNNQYFKYAPENYMKDTYGNKDTSIYKDKYNKLEYKNDEDPIQGSAYMVAVNPEKITNGAYNLLFEGTTQEDKCKLSSKN